MRILLFASILSALFTSCKGVSTVDLIVHHAVVYTVNDSFATAEAFAVKNGKIEAQE